LKIFEKKYSGSIMCMIRTEMVASAGSRKRPSYHEKGGGK